jgi:hypothetical protein
MTDLKKGQRVKLALEGTVHESGAGWVRVMLADGIETVYLETDTDTVVEVIHDPLPTERGVYVPGNNQSFAGNSYIYRYNGTSWSVLTTEGGAEGGAAAYTRAVNAHATLGGLVKLEVAQ